MQAIATGVLPAVAAANGPAPAWLPFAFPVFFIGMWLGVSSLLGFAAGHTRLVARFPPVDEHLEQKFGFASGRIRWVNFNSALYVGVGARGLHLAASWLWRPIFSRGIPCIPWNEVRLVRAQAGGVGSWFTGSRFEIPALKLRFSLHGKAGRAVEQRLATSAGPPSLPTSSRKLVREV